MHISIVMESMYAGFFGKIQIWVKYLKNQVPYPELRNFPKEMFRGKYSSEYLPKSVLNRKRSRTSGAPQKVVFLRQPSGVSPNVQDCNRRAGCNPSAILPFHPVSSALRFLGWTTDGNRSSIGGNENSMTAGPFQALTVRNIAFFLHKHEKELKNTCRFVF